MTLNNITAMWLLQKFCNFRIFKHGYLAILLKYGMVPYRTPEKTLANPKLKNTALERSVTHIHTKKKLLNNTATDTANLSTGAVRSSLTRIIR